MKKTQRFIVVLGSPEAISYAKPIIKGFHACTVIKDISAEILQNVFYYNKNAILMSESYNMAFSVYNPIVVRLSRHRTTDINSAVVSTRNLIEDFPKVLDSFNIDVGDHASHDSTGACKQSTDDCLLCKIYKRQTSNIEHIVYETQFFYVVPGTGAFFNGYLMIVPKSHVMSFANLSEEELSEFFNVLNDIRTILEGIYGQKVFAFECGSGRTGEGKHETSIVHAHFHLAVTDMPVLREVQKSGLHPALINKEQLQTFGECPYMLYVDQSDNWFIAADASTYYPRQHPRQVLAEYMGCYDIYNWRTHPFREKMDTIAEDFRSYCKRNLDFLPKWVKNYVQFDD